MYIFMTLILERLFLVQSFINYNTHGFAVT